MSYLDTGRTSGKKHWLFLTSHGLALLHLARRPEATAREVAEAVGVTQRQAQRVIRDLVAEGYVERERVGARYRYRVDRDAKLRNPVLASASLSVLLDAFKAVAAERPHPPERPG